MVEAEDNREREIPPKISKERSGVKNWIDHYLYCNWHRHRRASILCVWCKYHENCLDEQRHEFKLRKQRHKYFVALWGVQKRIVEEELMIVDPKEEKLGEWVNE